LIHLTGGRLETHFHVFGSLAFLAFYRDWKVLISATVIVALDHFLRGVFWPQSVFGIVTTSNWRWLEHAAWVVFEDVFLLVSIRQSLEEAQALAQRQASLESTNAKIELRVTERTAELTSEISERQKAEEALRESQRLYHSMVEQLPICVYRKDAEGRLIFVNTRFEKVGGLAEDTPSNDEISTHELIMRSGKAIESEKRHSQGDGSVLWFQTVKMPVFNDAGRIVGSQGIYFDITQRKQAEEKLVQLHEQLVDASRQAGMAEVATNVLHNVGNVLNSVNVSGSLIGDRLKRSRISNVSKIAQVINSQKDTLPDFFANDSTGKQLPDYLAKLAANLEREREEILKEITSLTGNINHIKEIVSMQQNYARSFGVLELHSVAELVEDAIRMNDAAMTRHEVTVVRDFAEAPAVLTDKHKVLQILTNIIRNAKYACSDSQTQDKRINLSISNGGDCVRVVVADNGIGIPKENLTRIFNHGFTTRKEGHGFGLHSGALAAKEIGGRLIAYSEGTERGATFTLELPVKHQKDEHE